jgi:UDP-N-acetylmuramate-alanine ligase
MSLFGKKKTSRMQDYLAQHPNARTVVITGSHGHTSAINAPGMILGHIFTVSLGAVDGASPDVVLIDTRLEDDLDWLNPDIAVVISCDNDEDARRAFNLANRAKKVVVNYNNVPNNYAHYLLNPEVTTYGNELPADYFFENHEHTVENGQKGDIVNIEREHIPVEAKILGEHNMRYLVMATIVAKKFGVTREQIIGGLEAVRPVYGRMSPARGLRGSYIIDDSADESPESIQLGLLALYSYDAAARILVIDDVMKLHNINLDLLTDVLVLTETPRDDLPEKFHQFATEIELINYLGGRLGENVLVLLEIPIPEIIESYLW